MERKTLIVSRNEISEELKRSTKTRWITAGVAIAIFLPALLLGEWPFFVFMTAVLLIAVWELLHSTGQKYPADVYICMYVFAILLTYWPIIRGAIMAGMNGASSWTLYYEFDSIYLSIIVLASMLFFFFLIVVLHPYFTVRDACFFFTLMVLICIGVQGLLYLRFLPLNIAKYVNNTDFGYFGVFNLLESNTLFVFVALATFLNDAGAYFIGIYFGKHKINERISPKKTWEGFVGGLFTGTIVCFVFGMILAAVGHPMLPFSGGSSLFDLNHWYNILILSLILPIFGTLGDFVFSSVKRYYEFKDFGHILPGHGGVLDRLDSLIFAFVGASILVAILTSASNGVNFLL